MRICANVIPTVMLRTLWHILISTTSPTQFYICDPLRIKETYGGWRGLGTGGGGPAKTGVGGGLVTGTGGGEATITGGGLVAGMGGGLATGEGGGDETGWVGYTLG